MESTSDAPKDANESFLQTIEHDVEAVQTVVEGEVKETAERLPVVARVYSWLEDRLPKSTRGRMLVAVILATIVLIPSVLLLVVTLLIPDLEEKLGNYGYLGVFLANLASTGTVFLPVPGLTLAGQALIVDQAKTLNPVLVGLAGGTGMALGEVTAYAAGAAGSTAVTRNELKAPERIRSIVERVIGAIDWLMDRYGFVMLVVLSAIPNPVFELAGVTAGAARMNFWSFMVAVLIGKNIRGLVRAFAGDAWF